MCDSVANSQKVNEWDKFKVCYLLKCYWNFCPRQENGTYPVLEYRRLLEVSILLYHLASQCGLEWCSFLCHLWIRPTEIMYENRTCCFLPSERTSTPLRYELCIEIISIYELRLNSCVLGFAISSPFGLYLYKPTLLTVHPSWPTNLAITH